MLSLNAFAKINWTLNILGKRPDGYHQMDMLMQTVSLCDRLTFEKADDILLKGESHFPTDEAQSGRFKTEALSFGEDNLIIKAAKRLQAQFSIRKGVSIQLSKHIPFGAGMGGGSADAAATLLGLNRLWELHLTREQLCEIALELGADIPFMLHGGFARVQGIGEIIRPLSPAPKLYLVLLKPCGGFSTGKVFAEYDAKASNIPRPDNDSCIQVLQSGSVSGLKKSGGNVLQAILKDSFPKIEKNIEMLYAVGASYAAMTGSGCVVYGAFESKTLAEQAAKQLQNKGKTVWEAETLSSAWPFDERNE